MLEKAEQAVMRARELDWTITVGDAQGIDNRVVDLCLLLGDIIFVCYGVTALPRLPDSDARHKEWPNGTYVRVKGDYLARDRHMVENADIGFFVWNGRSRGTKYTYDKMVKSGKRTDMWTPEGGYEETRNAPAKPGATHPAQRSISKPEAS